MMPSPADLVTLDQVKGYVEGAAGVPDIKLSGLITAVSMAIIAMMGRGGILPKSYTEVHDGSPAGVMLKNWPVLSVESVTIAESFGAPTALTGAFISPATDSQVGAPQMLTVPDGRLWRGNSNVKVIYTAGYQISGESATVPVGGGMVSVAAPQGAWGSDRGVLDAAGNALASVSVAPQQGQYQVSAGTYTFSAADAGTKVAISYGYIPADLANAALEWIADRLAYQSRIGMSSKSIGGQETVSFKIASTPDFVKAMIASYFNVVPVG